MSADFVDATQQHPTDGRRTTGAFLGTAMRHCRRAVELNLRNGPSAGVVASVRQAREALDGAAWLCDYVAAEGER